MTTATQNIRVREVTRRKFEQVRRATDLSFVAIADRAINALIEREGIQVPTVAESRRKPSRPHG